MKNLLATFAALCFLFTSCSNQNNSSNETAIDSMLNNNSAALPETPAVANVVDSNAIITTSPIPDSMQAPMQQPMKVAAGMNPAHGEPGHRCDIAVGAPLNSAPASPPASNVVTMPSTNTTVTPSPTPAATPVVTAPGMNPPHGEPGHDCKIAVGAPLKK